MRIREQAEAQRAAARSSRDTTQYEFLGQVYNKRNLVLAVVTQYIHDHPQVTLDELRQVFPDFLHSSFGVVAPIEKAIEKGQKRYFLDESQILRTGDNQTVAVCNQWGIGNIGPFLDIAKQLGHQITAQ